METVCHACPLSKVVCWVIKRLALKKTCSRDTDYQIVFANSVGDKSVFCNLNTKVDHPDLRMYKFERGMVFLLLCFVSVVARRNKT